MGCVLAMLALLAAAAAGDAPPAEDCPARLTVEAEIGRLGAARALALTGTTAVTIDDSGMQIVLRAHDDQVLGMRRVVAPADCRERAVVAAVVIVAWLGQWSSTEPRGTAAPAPPPPLPAPQVLATLPVTRAPGPSGAPRAAESTARGDVAAFAFGIHDGDAGTWGAGAQARYAWSDRLSVIALGEGTGERVQPLGPGRAAYRVLRAGVGIALRGRLGRGFIDGAADPEVFRLSMHGQDLALARGASVWGLAVDGRVRWGLNLARVSPFVYASASYSLTTAHLTLDNRTDSLTLSRWGLAAGLGVLFSFGATRG